MHPPRPDVAALLGAACLALAWLSEREALMHVIVVPKEERELLKLR
jgi:hypothetical protein